MQEAAVARLRCGWQKFKDIASSLSKRLVSLKLRGSMYKSCARSVVCYGAQCWALKKKDQRKLQTTKMRMPRMICGKILRNGIRNKIIHQMTGVKIEEFLRKQKLRWLCQIEKMNNERARVKAKIL